MKYANLTLDDNKGVVNCGDWVQVFAVENLYRYMGVDLSEVVKVKISDLSSYKGERLVLPINYPFFGMYDLSDDIIPVYLGISMISACAAKGLKMDKYQPIGCRDHHTLSELRKIGLNAYYGGCLTITLGKRDNQPKEKCVYISDVDTEILDCIPNEIRENSLIRHHVLFGIYGDGRVESEKLFEEYKEKATLVITSKIHCAQPCIAMGIPVVFICNKKSFRYDVLKPYIPVYSKEEIGSVDWAPNSVDVEKFKEAILTLCASRVRSAYENENDIEKLETIFPKEEPSSSEKIDSVSAFQEYVHNHYNKDDTFGYGVWGITQAAYYIVEWIQENYPNAILSGVYDKRRFNEYFNNVKIEKVDKMMNFKGVIFLTAGNALDVAESTFEKLNVKKYVISYNGVNKVGE